MTLLQGDLCVRAIVYYVPPMPRDVATTKVLQGGGPLEERELGAHHVRALGPPTGCVFLAMLEVTTEADIGPLNERVINEWITGLDAI